MAPNYESVLGRYLHDNNDAALARRVASELVFLDPGFMKRIAKGPQSEEMSSLALEMVTRSENQIVKLQRDIEVGDVALVCKLNEYIHDWPLPKLFPLFKAALKSDELVYKDLTAELIEKQGEHLKTMSFLNLLDADGPARPDSPSVRLCIEFNQPLLLLRIFPSLDPSQLDSEDRVKTTAWLKTYKPRQPQSHSLLCISKLSTILSVPIPIKLVAQHADQSLPPKIFVERNAAGLEMLSKNNIRCQCVTVSIDPDVEIINMGLFSTPWEVVNIATEAAETGEFFGLFLVRGLKKQFIFPYKIFESFLFVPSEFSLQLNKDIFSIAIQRPCQRNTPSWSRTFLSENKLDSIEPNNTRGCGNVCDVYDKDGQQFFKGLPILFKGDQCPGTSLCTEKGMAICNVVEGSLAERLEIMAHSFHHGVEAVRMQLSETLTWDIAGAIGVGTASPREPKVVNLSRRNVYFQRSSHSFVVRPYTSDPIRVDSERGFYTIHVGGDVYLTYALLHTKTKHGEEESQIAVTHVLRAPLYDNGFHVRYEITIKSIAFIVEGTPIFFFFDDAKSRGFEKKVPETIVKDVLKRKSAILGELALFAIDENSIAVFSIDSYDDPETLLAAAKRRGGEAGDETSSFFNLLRRHREHEAGKAKLATMQAAAAEREEREAAEAAAAARERALLVKAERAGRAGRSVPVSRAAKKEAARQKKKNVAEKEESLAALRFHEGKKERQQAFEEKQMCEHEAAMRRKAEAAEKKEAERRMRNALPALEEEFAPPVHDDISLWTKRE